MNHRPTHHSTGHGSFETYSIGFVLSLILTVAAFIVVTDYLASSHAITIISLLAVAQLVIQAVFFLHLGTNKAAQSNTLAFIFTACMVWFIVIGSIWIMNHLNENMMPEQIGAYMHKQN